MPRPRRVLGYARVSSAEQALGTSLSDQQEAIKAYAKARGVGIAGMYVEAESAVHEKIELRAEIHRLMADVRKDDLIVCDKLDRWSRDPEFTYRSVREILAKGAHFFAVGDQCDPSTSEGDTMLGFRVLFAREEHKRIRQRTVGTRNLLRARGYYVEGAPPYGYRRSRPAGTKDVSKNILVIDEPKADQVRKMFRMCIAGKSLNAICDALGLGKKRVWSSLHCRSYLGEILTERGWIKGLHPAIISPDLFAMANELLRNRRLGGPRPSSAASRTDSWILRDVAFCARCGSRISSAYGNNPEVDHYYRCFRKCQSHGNRATNGSYMRVDKVDASFGPLMLDRLQELREEIAVESEPPPRLVSSDERRVKLRRKRERHLEAFSEDLMTQDELRAALAKVDAEMLKLDAEDARSKKLPTTARRELLRELTTIEKAWRRADGKRKRELVNLLVERAEIASGVQTRVTWRTKEAISAGVWG